MTWTEARPTPKPPLHLYRATVLDANGCHGSYHVLERDPAAVRALAAAEGESVLSISHLADCPCGQAVEAAR